MTSPIITVITVCYNSATKIEETIQSIINQSYSNIEYIIIDGGSSDGTVEIIKKYSSKISYWISEKDNGIYDAMNKGIQKATGEWINFMNCGDYFYDSDVLKNIFSNNYDNVDVIYGNSISYGKDGSHYNIISGENINDLEYGPIYRHGASFVRTNVHKEFLFDLTKISIIKYALDFDVIYRLYKSGKVFKKTNSFIFYYEREGVSNNDILNKYLNYRITSEYKFSFSKFMILIKSIYLIYKNRTKNYIKRKIKNLIRY